MRKLSVLILLVLLLISMLPINVFANDLTYNEEVNLKDLQNEFDMEDTIEATTNQESEYELVYDYDDPEVDMEDSVVGINEDELNVVGADEIEEPVFIDTEDIKEDKIEDNSIELINEELEQIEEMPKKDPVVYIKKSNPKSVRLYQTENFNVDSSIGTRTSKLGKVRTSEVKIYDKPNGSNFIVAGDTYNDLVFFIKLEAKVNNNTFYLLSTEPSSERGLVGWVRSNDVTSYDHRGVDSKAKTFYFKGKGVAYNRIWGGRKNLVLSQQDLEKLKYQKFTVNLTEKVGNNIWYRGTYSGSSDNIWIHSSHLTTKEESVTSRVGQIRESGIKIYPQIDDPSTVIESDSTLMNKVLYIKKQMKFDDRLFYLISTEPSSEKGVIGWIHEKDILTYSHVGVDNAKKMLYLKGQGVAYSKIWGGSEYLVYTTSDLEKRAGYGIEVNLTEKVGNNIWYRGIVDGNTIWIHSSHVSDTTGQATSRLGKIKNTNVSIFTRLGDPTSVIKAGDNHTGIVYYIKRETILNEKKYYLISNQPSSTAGLVGWVEEKNLDTHTHVGIDAKAKLFLITGSNAVAYNRPWGGLKNIIYNKEQIQNLESKRFYVHLTQKVGNNTWYRGELNGRIVWIHESHLSEQTTTYTNYNVTLRQALDKQMTENPQTDKYSNDPAYISANYVKIDRVRITGTNVNIRRTPDFKHSPVTSVGLGTTLTFLGEVTGANHQGSTKWYEVRYNNQKLYVHSSLATLLGTVTGNNVNVRSGQGTSYHIFGKLKKDTTVTILSRGSNWHRISYGTWRNAKRSDVEQYLNPNNHDKFQHLLLSGTAGLEAKDLQSLLSGKGTLNGTESIFITASRKYNVNEAYLVAHALLESGNGTSTLAKGVEVGKDSNGNIVLVTDSNKNSLTDIKKVYNMFGIAAVDSNPVREGARKAYEEGWTCVKKAIEGGAKWISENYVNHPSYQQNTLYKMRWNPNEPGTHQYATDIGWAVKQTNRIKEIYDQLPNPILSYDIPVYK